MIGGATSIAGVHPALAALAPVLMEQAGPRTFRQPQPMRIHPPNNGLVGVSLSVVRTLLPHPLTPCTWHVRSRCSV